VDIQICVVTDGGRVLGLGDLGIGGLGISIGKLALYTACAGIHPKKTLPIVIDFGTNNEELLQDSLYLGERHHRVDDLQQEEFMEEFMEAITKVYPKIIVQFEDFNSTNAFKWLDKFRSHYSCFNDDIQGTGAVILAGFIEAVKISGISPKDHRIVFHGAGSAAVGVAKMIALWIAKVSNIPEEAAKKQIWLVDTKGLVFNSRGDKLAEYKIYFSRVEHYNYEAVDSLEKILEAVKPTCLIGLCTVGGIFTNEILSRMGSLNTRPIIMPLSNPSKNAECTFKNAMEQTNGRVIFASGSPFAKFEYEGKIYKPGQGNNMYIFPGLGLGAILSNAKEISEDMVYAASETLAQCVTSEDLDQGMIYPSLDKIREVSLRIAVNVIKVASKNGHGKMPDTTDLSSYVKEHMYDPFYQTVGKL
jgi:malate dehydrogenase (oxaloacetate-decarboxylating)(NADP+)